ncbi:STM3941 family protein [Nocardia sp. NPDC058497]|uniref:STM3941 family protein n=1 Tax=Nocardia sp. NPDC058497 TaxID=3346529 RepID=UPI0036560324
MVTVSFGFVALCVWIVSSDDVPIFPLVAGWLGIMLFAAGGIFFGDRLIRRRPELVLTDDGLEHRQWGRLRWDEVTSVRTIAISTSAISKMRYIQIGLRDPEAFYARSSGWIRLLAKSNQKLGYGTVNLPSTTLGAPIAQVLTAMRFHRPDLIIRD